MCSAVAAFRLVAMAETPGFPTVTNDCRPYVRRAQPSYHALGHLVANDRRRTEEVAARV